MSCKCALLIHQWSWRTWTFSKRFKAKMSRSAFLPSSVLYRLPSCRTYMHYCSNIIHLPVTSQRTEKKQQSHPKHGTEYDTAERLHWRHVQKQAQTRTDGHCSRHTDGNQQHKQQDLTHQTMHTKHTTENKQRGPASDLDPTVLGVLCCAHKSSGAATQSTICEQ